MANSITIYDVYVVPSGTKLIFHFNGVIELWTDPQHNYRYYGIPTSIGIDRSKIIQYLSTFMDWPVYVTSVDCPSEVPLTLFLLVNGTLRGTTCYVNSIIASFDTECIPDTPSTISDGYRCIELTINHKKKIHNSYYRYKPFIVSLKADTSCHVELVRMYDILPPMLVEYALYVVPSCAILTVIGVNEYILHEVWHEYHLRYYAIRLIDIDAWRSTASYTFVDMPVLVTTVQCPPNVSIRDYLLPNFYKYDRPFILTSVHAVFRASCIPTTTDVIYRSIGEDGDIIIKLTMDTVSIFRKNIEYYSSHFDRMVLVKDPVDLLYNFESYTE